ncbi:hypothetical protein NA78x_003981 [Anatilimnocola sp. NA78]|uniref:hypothetical protein n=1 Tax=Anatilimnocola sp. NA78 TaxID=3415683 RepID=UPI003CE4724F
MLMFLLLFVVFAIAAGALWFHGLWGNAITLINLMLAMLLATNFYEPVATMATGFSAGANYFWDFAAVWVLFFIFFVIFRVITDGLSQQPVKFIMPVEMAGRTVLSLWSAWLMVCFVTFTLQMAPLNSVEPMGAWKTPTEGTFLGFAPDRMWLGFMQKNSRGYLSRGNYSGVVNASKDQDTGAEVFDPYGEFTHKYRYRREKYAALSGMTPE